MKRKPVTPEDILWEYPSESMRKKGKPGWETHNKIIKAPNDGRVYCTCMPCVMGIGKTGKAECKHLDDYFAKHADGVGKNKVGTTFTGLRRWHPIEVKDCDDESCVRRNYGGAV